MLTTSGIDLNQTFENIAETLDLTPDQYKKAETSYITIGKWLDTQGTNLAQYKPVVYPQGSVVLGTITKPLMPDKEFDIDLVCELINFRGSPVEIKQLVGDRLKENNLYVNTIEERNRCWRINFKGDFHLDVLPAVNAGSGTAINIPDKELRDWQKSDPNGYLVWFKSKMAVQFQLKIIALAQKQVKSLEEIPEYLVKTTLQKAIQLMKRHRDILFKEDKINKPVSKIFTTLAALCYRNQSNLFETIYSFATEMTNHIEQIEGLAWVKNPVNFEENFADKWQKYPHREQLFYSWVKSLQNNLDTLKNASSADETEKILVQMFGEDLTKSVLSADSKKSQADPVISFPQSKPTPIINPAKPWKSEF